MGGQAHVAGGAVEEVLPAAYSADAAAVAVELLLVVVVEELALVAEVLAEDRLAGYALRGHGLARAADAAHHLPDVFSLQRVVLVLVVAKSTPVRLLTAGRLQQGGQHEQ